MEKEVGDRVVKGEIIAEVDTEKAAIEIESFHTGVIEQLIAKPGERVPVGTVMAIIREEGTQAQPDAQAPASTAPLQTVSPKKPVPSLPPCASVDCSSAGYRTGQRASRPRLKARR